ETALVLLDACDDGRIAPRQGGDNFFFQAEDGIRDLTVTGVQTCALPICWNRPGGNDGRPGGYVRPGNDRGPGWNRPGGNDGRPGGYVRPGNDRGPGWNRPGTSQRWSNDWRRDRRYDWNGYRQYNREAFRLPRYYAPGGWGYGYRRFGVG